MNHSRCALIGSIGLAAMACIGCSNAMDALGRESAVTETAHKADVITNDRIEDKHPKYDSKRTVDEAFGSQCVIRLNKSGSVTKLDIVNLDDDEADLEKHIFSSRQAAAEYVSNRLGEDASLIPGKRRHEAVQ